MDRTEELRSPVDIIIPVYRDLDVTRRCVDSVLRHTPEGTARVILVDDASPEAALSAWCDQLAESGKVELLRNESNLGFVASVNRGMALHDDCDVVLLNSDTEVPPDWLRRLQACATQADDIATATPFSNNATICSYPFFAESSEIPEGLDLISLDQLFARANRGKSLEIPTGVGFCLYIRRACLAQIGFFDAERYGRGYGEENDFCRRAQAKGWRNLLCADVFVYHQGAVSFGDDRQALMAQAAELLEERYPDYPAAIARFVAEDPPRVFRDAVDRLRLELPGQASRVMAEGHAARDLLLNRLREADRLLVDWQWQYEQRRNEYEQRSTEYEQRCEEYERLLREERSLFAATDRALTEAQHIAADKQREIVELGAALEECRTELHRIKNSRLWRYSRWLQNLVDK